MSDPVSNLNTQIETLTQEQKDLTQLLEDRGWVIDEINVESLQRRISRTINNKLKQQEDLGRELTLETEALEQIENEWAIANQHYQDHQTRLDKMQQREIVLTTQLELLKQQKISHQEEFEQEQERGSTTSEVTEDEIFKTIEEIVAIRQGIADQEQEVTNIQEQIDELIGQRNHHQNLANHHHHHRHRWGVVGRDRSGRAQHGWIPNPEHIRLRDQHRGIVNQLNSQITQLNEQKTGLSGTLERERPGLESQIDALGSQLSAYQQEREYQEYLVQIQNQEFEQLIETLELQINQVEADISQLGQNIEGQSQATDVTKSRADFAQRLLDRATEKRDDAQTELEEFTEQNEIWLSADVSLETFHDNKQLINRFPRYYQLLVLQELEEVGDRLTTVQAQLEDAEAIATVVEPEIMDSADADTDTNADADADTDAYEKLTDTLTESTEAAIVATVEVLDANYDLTENLWEESQEHSEQVEELETFITDTLAGAHETHYLNQVQLDEAVQRQAGQIAYQDALAASVDSTEETVELLRLQVEHVEEISQQLSHLKDLVNYESQHVEVGNIEEQIQTLRQQQQTLTQLNQAIVKSRNGNQNKLAELVQQSKVLQGQLETTLNDFVISLRKTDFLPDEIQNQIEAYVETFNTIQADKEADLDQVRDGVVQGIVEDESYLQKLYGLQTFANAKTYSQGFTINRGNWSSQDQYPRQLADVNGDGRVDIVGFSHDMVVVALGQEGGTFSSPKVAFRGNFTVVDGWTSQNIYPRQLADVNGDGRADIVGFGHDAVMVSLGQEDGTFAAPNTDYTESFTIAMGWEKQDKYPRFLADVNGDSRADIVGFGRNFVTVSLADENGQFTPETIAYGGGLTPGIDRVQDLYPRQVADINGDGRADLVAFGHHGVAAALAQEDGTFAPHKTVHGTSFTIGKGGWSSQNRYPRQVIDVNGDGRADIVGFASTVVVVSLAKEDGTFAPQQTVHTGYDVQGGWTSQNQFPRQLADVNGDGRVDIVGFSQNDVHVSFSNVRQQQEDELTRILHIQAGSTSYDEVLAPISTHLDDIAARTNDYKVATLQPQLAAQLNQEIT
ncbi:MAG: hypothetical protein F6K30_22715, partial [Cyanothece sp. SIO2G6]|nr:hypothetical protein [Cyanothece sp. SIO2G6]